MFTTDFESIEKNIFGHFIIISSHQHGYHWPSHAILVSSNASNRSSGLRPVSAQSSCMHDRASRSDFPRPCEGVHRSTSLMSSSLLLQQCPACLVRLILIVIMMGGRWMYSGCFVGCCLHDFLNRHLISIKID